MSIKTLSRDLVFYGFLDLLQRSVSIIIVPIYTRVLTQQEYGNLDIMLITASVLCILVDLQFIAGYSRLYYEHCNEGTGKRFTGTAIVSRLVGSLALSTCFLVLGFLGALEVSFLPSFKYNTVAWSLAVIHIPLSLTYEVLLLQTRMLRWKKLFALGTLSNCVLAGTLGAFLAVILEWGIIGVVLGLFIGSLTSVLLLGWGLRKEVQLCFDFKPFKKLARYSLPLLPGWWLAFASAYFGRFFIFSELGANENAILAVCMKVASVIGLFAVAFETAWRPLAMSHIGNAAGNVFYVRSMNLFIAGSVFSMFCVSVFLDPILYIFVPSTYNAVQYYFPLFVVGIALSGIANNLQLGHQIAKTTYWISIAAFISFAINLVILIALTDIYRIFAVGVAWVVSYAAKDIFVYYTAQKEYHIPYDKKSFIFLLLGCGLLLVLGFVSYRQLIPSWLFISCLALSGITLPWLIIKDTEWPIIKELFRQRGLYMFRKFSNIR